MRRIACKIFLGNRTRIDSVLSLDGPTGEPWRLIFALIRRTAKLICSWCFCSCTSTNSGVVDHAKFFRSLGQRVRELRREKGYSQEDMISFGFSARHWQQIEAGRPITVTTLLRICDVLKVHVDRLVRNLDKTIYLQ